MCYISHLIYRQELFCCSTRILYHETCVLTYSDLMKGRVIKSMLFIMVISLRLFYNYLKIVNNETVCLWLLSHMFSSDILKQIHLKP